MKRSRKTAVPKSRTTQEAKSTVGRPRKYKGENTSTISARVPESVRAHLERSGDTASSAAYEVLLFEKELYELLEQHLLDLRVNAATHGKDYSVSRADTLARLVKVGLSAEKKQKRVGRDG